MVGVDQMSSWYPTYDLEAVIQDADIELAQMLADAAWQEKQCVRGNHGQYEYTNKVTGVVSCSFCGKDNV